MLPNPGVLYAVAFGLPADLRRYSVGASSLISDARESFGCSDKRALKLEQPLKLSPEKQTYKRWILRIERNESKWTQCRGAWSERASNLKYLLARIMSPTTNIQLTAHTSKMIEFRECVSCTNRVIQRATTRKAHAHNRRALRFKRLLACAQTILSKCC